MNTYPPPDSRIPYFADVRVRQAVAYGFDRVVAVKTAWGDLAQPLTGWIALEHWAGGGGGFGTYALDTSRAASLLDQAGWRDEDDDGIREWHGEDGDYGCQRGKWSIQEKTPLSPQLILVGGNSQQAVIAQKIQSDLKQIGVEVRVTTVAPETFFNGQGPVQRRGFDMAIISAAMRPDPGGVSRWVGADVFQHPLDHTFVHRWQLEQRWLESEQLVERAALNNVPSPNNDWQGQNYAGWCDEQADLAIAQANRSFDLSARKASYGLHESLLAAGVPIVPLDYRPRLAASKLFVCGIQPVSFEPLTWNAFAWSFDRGASARQHELD